MNMYSDWEKKSHTQKLFECKKYYRTYKLPPKGHTVFINMFTHLYNFSFIILAAYSLITSSYSKNFVK